MTLPLLDVNVLIALADPDHVHHERAHAWASHGLANGWASCAITENGFVRILSQPAYPRAFTVAAAVGLLRSARAVSGHQFWPSNVSLADPEILDATSLLGHRLITDAYLLALAVRHDSALVTLDTSIPLTAVPGAKDRHLISI